MADIIIRYYYQHDKSRLPACTLPIHGMLHIADDILSIRRDWSQLTMHETVFKDYDAYVLHPPRVTSYEPDHDEWVKVALYFRQLIGGRRGVIVARLPAVMALWKKVRIQNGGDSIRTHSATSSSESTISHISSKYEHEYEDRVNGALHVVQLVQYGHLEKILVFSLSNDTQWRGLAGKTLLLVLIRPCQTEGRNATKEEARYSRNLASIITDLWNVKGVVGMVKSHREWTIIDRRSSFAKPAFDGAGYNTDESEAE
ncbi:uncharacterized protein F5891DRAFT_948301 [Suillus fuscotomentosus]|uniref:Uncharacterized protein n=1 Tax=Suillus fuscotomentosus TaxID=1912939 RepID=A0AAD4EB85_9AGAM|nr:uncharacterized protein F5891DRAFT_948301 [Suillus fuscotomentosus]KAG1902777.1 hypothetical protein F5891DRAFT_948301 [Suillus fuscotomentosus]